MAVARAELLCPVLVGRDAERETLTAALERAAAGGTAALFLAGEAGVGKSRLCAALMDQARSRGLMPIVGHASAHDSALPYGPFVAALERAFRRLPPERSPLAERIQPFRDVLATLLPDLAPRQGDSRTDVPANAALQLRWIFEALATALFALAEQGPGTLVLVVEDLHWADDTSIDLIQQLILGHARGDYGQPQEEGRVRQGLLLLGTYRCEAVAGQDLGAGHAVLARAVASLVSQRVARELALGPLTSEEHVALLTATLGHPPIPHLAHALYLRSDGNPFVAEELMAALDASGQLRADASGARRLAEGTLRLPLSLRAAVLARLEGLSAEARRVLTIAAVIGREFQFDVLQRVAGVDEAALLGILREGVARQLLVEDQGQAGAQDAEEQFRFRHALTRDAIDGELLARERRSLHLRVAETLEALLSPEAKAAALAGSLATHYSLGGDPARAHPYAVAAAEYALRVGALAEAAEHLDRAVAALPEGDPGSVALLELQGRVRVALLEVPRAAELLWRARTIALAAGMRWHAAAIGSELAFLTWFADPAASNREWIALLAEAEARTLSDEPEDETALRLYSAAAMCSGSNDAHRTALAWAERAAVLADRLGTSTERHLFRAHVGRGMARVDTGAFDEGIEDLRLAIALGVRYADPHLALAYNVLIAALTEIGRDDQALAVFDEAREFEQRTGAVVAPPPVIYAYLASGRWDEGLAVATAQVEGYASFGIPTTPQGLAMAGLGHLLLRRGRAREALEHFEAAWERLHAVRDFAWAARCLWGRAMALATLGRRGEAREVLERTLSWWERTEDRGTAVPMLLEALLFATVDGDRQMADRCLAGLQRTAEIGNPVALAALAHANGRMALWRGEPDAAAAHFQGARDAWRAIGRPFHGALAERALAEALLAGRRDQERRAEADTLLQQAERSFASLGAADAATATEEIRRRSGLLGQARRKDTMDAARAQTAGLTRREVEVLRCLVEGMTNREIASTLFITEGTAELHVSRILGKLNCSTRTQAAARAGALGLAAPVEPQ